MGTEQGVGQRYLAIGNVVGVHGVRGELKVEPLTDFPERFKAGARIFMGSEESARPVEIAAARPHQQHVLVRLTTVNDRNAAELLRGQLLLIPEEEAMPLGADENYVHDMVGLQVETDTGEALGTLTEVLYTGANDVYVVAGAGGEILIPALRTVVLEVDLPGRRMVVALPEGLTAESA